MKPIGRVAAILNEVHVLLQMSEPVAIGEDVSVFGKAELPPPTGEVALREVTFPKGNLRILAEQAEPGYYLASRFRDEKERRVVKQPFGGVYGALLGDQEIVETVYGDWSARINKEQALNVALDKQIGVGDTVGRLS